MKNAYSNKPSLPYNRTTVEMGSVVSYLQSLAVPIEVKRASYIFFRIESGNGRSGVNNNYAGIQADGARWPALYDNKIAGTVTKKENGTGKERIFIAFHSWKDSVDFTVNNAERRGLYIGGTTFHITKMNVVTPQDLCVAYKREWVTGKSDYNPVQSEFDSFISIYNQAEKIF